MTLSLVLAIVWIVTFVVVAVGLFWITRRVDAPRDAERHDAADDSQGAA